MERLLKKKRRKKKKKGLDIILEKNNNNKIKNIILKSIKGHSVEKFGKIMCISNNMDQCINKILSKSIHYF